MTKFDPSAVEIGVPEEQPDVIIIPRENPVPQPIPEEAPVYDPAESPLVPA